MAVDVGNFVDNLALTSLNEVIALFHDDFAYGRPNLYEVVIGLPQGVPLNANALGIFSSSLPDDAFPVKDIQARAESIIMPGRSMNIQLNSGGAQYGPQRELVTEPLYADEISMTIQGTAGHDERLFLEAWQKLSYNDMSFNTGYYKNYIGQLDIYLLDQNERRTYGIRLRECFPKTIAPMDLGYGPKEEIRKTLVTWTFRDWINLAVETGDGKGLGERLVDNFQDQVVKSINNAIPAVVRRLD